MRVPRLIGMATLFTVGCGAGASKSPAPAQTVVQPSKAEPTPRANTDMLVLLGKDGSRWYFLDSREAACAPGRRRDTSAVPTERARRSRGARGQLFGLFSVCASTEGKVAKAEVREGSGSDSVDRRWLETLRSWRYRPYLVGGKPVAFCSEARLKTVAPS